MQLVVNFNINLKLDLLLTFGYMLKMIQITF